MKLATPLPLSVPADIVTLQLVYGDANQSQFERLL